MIKKYVYLFLCILLGASLLAIPFILGAILNIIISGFDGDYSTIIILALLVLVILIPISFALMIVTRLYDGKSKNNYKSISDWRFVMRALLGVLCLFIVVVAALVSEKSANEELVIWVATISILVSVAIFDLNYHNLLPRRERINEIIKKSSLAYESTRRGSFLVTEVVDENTVICDVFGKLQKNDQIVSVDYPASFLWIKQIIVDNKKVKKIDGGKAKIKLSALSNVTSKFEVYANYEPRCEYEKVNVTENPALRTFIEAYEEHKDEEGFASAMLYYICHANYLIPALIDAKDIKGDLMDTYKDSASFMTVAVSNENDPDKGVFPIFTDWEALKEYNVVIDTEQAITFVISFPRVIQMMREGKYDGVVINPFGPGTSYFMSDEYVMGITELEGYQRDFIYNEEQ